MSGFAGVFHLDGAPVDRDWLAKMADFLVFRGPDHSQIWFSGNAGLVHTLLRTTSETDGRPQIATLDGLVWIAADVRIDDRETLFAKLNVDSEAFKESCSAELVLHAYAKWGEACVEHLLGDFSFVIWDSHRKRVFGARDQLGVRPFFYAQVGQCLIVSNTLECIRQCPIVSDDLNENAIGDFLLVGENKDPGGTYFATIKRLPASYRLSVEHANGVRTQRYWTLPIDEPLYFKKSSDYVDRFSELLKLAVRDRLPDGKLGIHMSGGLDSPAIAAAAVGLGADAIAFTHVYERLIPDQEGYYAGLVAKHLRMPIHFHRRDDEPWGWEAGSPPLRTTEPLNDPLCLRASRDYHNKISQEAKVFFLGDGPDVALFYEWKPHVRWLIEQKKWSRLCKDLIADFAVHPRLPFFHRLPGMWRNHEHDDQDRYKLSFPKWVNPQFESRLSLRSRWERIGTWEPSTHPTRQIGYGCFADDFPLGGTDLFDSGFTGAPVDFLHPLWDLRLLRFLLQVPTMPWCRNKHLMRVALKGLIPEPVRVRPKSPLPGYPYIIRAQRSDLPELPPVSKLETYVNLQRVPQWPGKNREEIDLGMRVLGLHYWFLGL
jgi:asparagine synthase (glutamine-hydrolysing)